MFVLAFGWSICLYGMTEMEGKEEGGPPKEGEDSCYKKDKRTLGRRSQRHANDKVTYSPSSPHLTLCPSPAEAYG